MQIGVNFHTTLDKNSGGLMFEQEVSHPSHTSLSLCYSHIQAASSSSSQRVPVVQCSLKHVPMSGGPCVRRPYARDAAMARGIPQGTALPGGRPD